VLQAAIHHGPADLSIWIFTETAADWDWAKWLPHVVVDSAGRRRIAATAGEVETVAALLPEEDADAHRRHLVVVDLPDLAAGPRARIREALRDGNKRGIAAVALARRSIDLPSLSTTVVSTTSRGTHVRFPDGSSVATTPWTAGTALARRVARGVARVRDPEATISGSDLPDVVHLAGLRGMSDDLSHTVTENWRQSRDRPVAVLGSAGDGPFSVDLVADGPHALLAGTTGAGKSELLRTLVASLAASSSPESLNFVLVDYKGGSAFDACADLPHTVGLVTDLDDHLAKRALSCLEAELRYREQRLRDAAVSDIGAYFDLGAAPLPRLLVVVDEFAALAMELPEFMSALVGIAQRGRSLGVHLLLATQRPNGVISDNIKANTNLRIALRVQDTADSVDVIGVGDAADVPGSLPGRGLARLGPREIVPFQTALVTGTSMEAHAAAVSISPFTFAHEQTAPRNLEVADSASHTDLERIVAACVEAAGQTGIDQPRLPWPAPLPAALSLQDLPAPRSHLGEATLGLADEPHRQRTMPASWAPTSGNLLLYGLPGSGTTTALATIATALCDGSSPDALHLHVMDFDDQRLHPLSALPHVGSVIAGRDRERQLRLVRRLSAELEARRSATATGSLDTGSSPTIVTMIDNYAGFADSYGEPGDMGVHNLLARLVADGPGVGMMTILTAKAPGDIPTRIASLVAQRLVFRLADRYDYTALGVPPVDPPEIAGRAFEAGSGREVQVALPHPDGLEAAIDGHSVEAPSVAPWTIDVLPNEVSIIDFISAARITKGEWFLPLGIGDSFLDPAGLVLREGEHALITGPARSGKTTALATLASVARAAHPGLRIAALIPRESKLRQCEAIDDVVSADDLGDALRLQRESLLLVDDVELIDGGDRLSSLIKERHPLLRVIGAGSADAIRGLYGHWTQDLRRSRIGCALRPNIVSDGDLWQTQLPRNGQMQFPVGRGYLLADGQTELIQLGCG
jgi:S-DNA-T family DNA segregation ATPase FtsK/SpoIIIE